MVWLGIVLLGAVIISRTSGSIDASPDEYPDMDIAYYAATQQMYCEGSFCGFARSSCCGTTCCHYGYGCCAGHGQASNCVECTSASYYSSLYSEYYCGTHYCGFQANACCKNTCCAAGLACCTDADECVACEAITIDDNFQSIDDDNYQLWMCGGEYCYGLDQNPTKPNGCCGVECCYGSDGCCGEGGTCISCTAAANQQHNIMVAAVSIVMIGLVVAVFIFLYFCAPETFASMTKTVWGFVSPTRVVPTYVVVTPSTYAGARPDTASGGKK